MTETKNLHYIYREYPFDKDFPILHMTETTPSSEIDFFHFHNCIELAYCEKGSKNFIVENQNLTLHMGDACFIPPYHMHASYCDASHVACSCYQYLFFNVKDVLASFYPSGLPQELQWYQYADFLYKLDTQNFEQELFYIREIVKELENPPQLYTLSIRGLIHSLMVLLSRRFYSKKEMAVPTFCRTAIIPAISYLETHFQNVTSIDLLAELCHLTISQFRKDFKFALGQTPEQYVRFLRIQNACELLLKTEMSVLEIAMATGFSSSSSFYHHFKTMIGMNPEAWRHTRRSYPKKHYRYAPLLSFNSSGTGHALH